MSDTFNLIHEPWVIASDHRGVTSELSMLEVFEQAPNLAAIAGEIPTQAAAVLRLHLAVAYRALRHDLDVEAAEDEWSSWWKSGSLPVDQIHAYLDRYSGRFCLLDRNAPFMQVADLAAGSGKTSGLAKLIAEVPDGHQFFTMRTGAANASVTPAEAARWLVHLHAYDPSGIKTGAIGDPRVKGGRGYPIGQGWTGRTGLVIIEGQTLAETLLLNLDHSHPSPPGDMPVWERDPQSAAPDDVVGDGSGGQPRGVADLMTWQVRRTRLIAEGADVVDALVCNGDRISPQNRQAVEPSTAYRFSEPQTKVHGGVVYMPLEHRPEQALWRGLSALLAEAPSAATEKRERLGPPILRWLAGLRVNDIVAADHPISLHAIGMEYGSQASSVAGIIDDNLVLPLESLTESHARARVVAASDATQRGVRALQDLATNLAHAAGGDGEGARDRAAELGYSTVDQPFRRWLAVRAEDPDEHLDRWHEQARRLLRRAAEEIITAAGPPAVRGRRVTNRTGTTVLLDAGLAQIFFEHALRRALDRGLPRDPTTKEERA